MPVPGATVELIDGVPAGLATITDDSGSFSLGDVTLTIGQTKIRASKDSYTTNRIDPPNAAPRSMAGISLRSLTAPVIHPGEYTMSFVADSTCDLPEEARTRIYSATMTLSPGYINLPPERQADFSVALSGAYFVVGHGISPTNSLGVHVAADYVRFDLDPWGETHTSQSG
jgi:hypothetical protein